MLRDSGFWATSFEHFSYHLQTQEQCISFFGNNQYTPNFLLFAKVALANVSHEIPAYAG